MKRADSTTQPLLQITGLTTIFSSSIGTVTAVDSLDLSVDHGEIVCLVGESGCGKSVTALSVMGLIPSPPGLITKGTIQFKGVNLRLLTDKQFRRIRGKEIAMIFQEPMTSLNPVFTIGSQIMESILLHQPVSKRQARAQTLKLLETVAIPAPEQRLREYPHQLSGGMRQRVMIAMALACAPDLLIADEPTTALDVTIQAQILELLLQLREQFGLAILFITHDLGIVAEIADRVAVMYAGRLMETAPVIDLFAEPLHPYSQGLIQAAKQMFSSDTPDDITTNTTTQTGWPTRKRLPAIDGSVPSLSALPPGCAFAPRCRYATAKCALPAATASMHEPRPGRFVRCVLYGQPTL